jgi:hypothetical protein
MHERIYEASKVKNVIHLRTFETRPKISECWHRQTLLNYSTTSILNGYGFATNKSNHSLAYRLHWDPDSLTVSFMQQEANIFQLGIVCDAGWKFW